jgi:hypothetical protein
MYCAIAAALCIRCCNNIHCCTKEEHIKTINVYEDCTYKLLIKFDKNEIENCDYNTIKHKIFKKVSKWKSNNETEISTAIYHKNESVKFHTWYNYFGQGIEKTMNNISDVNFCICENSSTISSIFKTKFYDSQKVICGCCYNGFLDIDDVYKLDKHEIKNYRDTNGNRIGMLSNFASIICIVKENNHIPTKFYEIDDNNIKEIEKFEIKHHSMLNGSIIC